MLIHFKDIIDICAKMDKSNSGLFKIFKAIHQIDDQYYIDEPMLVQIGETTLVVFRTFVSNSVENYSLSAPIANCWTREATQAFRFANRFGPEKLT